MALAIYFRRNDGQVVPVTAVNPLPVSDSGGVTPQSISAVAPLVWDPGTSTIDATKDQAGGFPTLDGTGLLKLAQMPISGLNYHGNWDASTNTPTLADGTGAAGDMYRAHVAGTQDLGSGSLTFDVGDLVVYEGAVWQKFAAATGVISVNGHTGAVSLVKADIGLGNVDNTSDANKPVSTAQQTALDAKVDLSGDEMTGPLTVSTSSTIPITTIDTTGGGAGVVSVSDNGAAIANGSRVGYKLFGGATDDQHTINHSAGIVANATEAWTATAAGTALLFEVTPNGTLARIAAVEIHNDGTADFKDHRITGVINGQGPTDGVNYNQLAVERISGSVYLQLYGEDLVWPADIGAGKIRLWSGNGPAVQNRYYGFGIANGTLVFQGDENVNFTFNKATAADAQIELFKIANNGDLTAQGDLHMSEKRIANIADGVSPRDAVNKQQLDAVASGGGAVNPYGVASHNDGSDLNLTGSSKQIQVVDTAVGDTIVNLPGNAEGAVEGTTFTIKQGAAANGITINVGDGTAFIDGLPNIGIADGYGFRTVVYDGTVWHIVASGGA